MLSNTYELKFAYNWTTVRDKRFGTFAAAMNAHSHQHVSSCWNRI